MAPRLHRAMLCLGAVFTLAPGAARAALYELAASGTITENSSLSDSISIGTEWSFQLVYDTAAPDLDFELTGSPDPTFGRFTNGGVVPALSSFHYRAGSYEVTLAGPGDFATASAIDITFTSVHAIDINVFAPALFPSLGGGAVSFHADFNDFQGLSALTSDALPTDPSLGPDSFGGSTVSLLPPSGAVSGSSIASFSIRPVAEPSLAALALLACLAGLASARRA